MTTFILRLTSAGPGVAVAVKDLFDMAGLPTTATPYIITAVGILAGTFALPMFTTGDLQEVVSVFAVAAGYLVFAVLDRSRILAGLAAFIAAVPVLVLLSGAGEPGAITAAVTGTVVLATGLVSRREA